MDQAEDLDRRQRPAIMVHPSDVPATQRTLAASPVRDTGEGLPEFLAWVRRSGSPTVLLDAVGSIVYANEAARRVIARDDALRIVDDRLQALRVRDDGALQRMLMSALRAAETRAQVAMRLPRRSSGRDYLVQVTRIAEGPPEAIRDARGAVVCVLICDPDGVTAIDPRLLQDLFDLTPAEIRFVDQLLVGKTAEQLAADLGIAISTARYYMTRLYRKTQTRRQSELVSLLQRLAATALRP